MSTRWYSLKRRLLALLLGGVAVAWLATLVFSYFDAHAEVDELFDAQLAQSAQTLLALAGEGQGAAVGDLGPVGHKYQRHLLFQIWDADGRLLLRSNSAPETPLTVADGFTEIEDEQGHWRLYSQWNTAHRLQVQVSEDHRIRDELIGQIAWRLLLPALLGLPLLGLGVWLATRRGLTSLDSMAKQIASRDPTQLQPVVPQEAPVEIRPLLEALNGLLQRVDQALEGERRFTADAAHELRTPLAALQAQLQVARRARDSAEHDHSLAQLQEGLSRAAHLVEQMLQLARLDPESGLPNPQTVDLGKLAEMVCAELGNGILDRQLDFDLLAEPDCLVRGQPEWLAVALRNLIGNAMAYTPPGGLLKVIVRRQGACLEFAVEDSGPGIPASERAAVMQRFHRLPSANPGGSGLGLAIVGRIAELHGACCSLDAAPQGGLRASLVWQPASD